MQGPLISAQMAQTAGGEIDSLADPHTGQPGEQQGRSKQVVAAAQFGLEPRIVLRRQGPRQNLIGMGDVRTQQQPWPGWKSMIGQQVEQLTQSDQMGRAGGRAQGFAGMTDTSRP